MGLLKSEPEHALHVTVSGPPGVGKSALLRFAHAALGSGSIAQAEEGTSVETLIKHFRDDARQILFLDDADCLRSDVIEQLVHAVHPRVLVTSQVATSSSANVSVRLNPLACSPGGPAEKLLLQAFPTYYREAAMQERAALRWLVGESGGLPGVLVDFAAAVGPDGLSPVVEQVARHAVTARVHSSPDSRHHPTPMETTLHRILGTVPQRSVEVLRVLVQFDGPIDLPVAAATCALERDELNTALLPLLARHLAIIETVRGGYPLISVPRPFIRYLRSSDLFPPGVSGVRVAERHAQACLTVSRLRVRKQAMSAGGSSQLQLSDAHHWDMTRAARALVGMGRENDLNRLLDSANAIWLNPRCAAELSAVVCSVAESDPTAPEDLVLQALRLRMGIADWAGLARRTAAVAPNGRPGAALHLLIREGILAARAGNAPLARWVHSCLSDANTDVIDPVTLAYLRACSAIRLATSHPKTATELVRSAVPALARCDASTSTATAGQYLLVGTQLRLAATPPDIAAAAARTEKLLTGGEPPPAEVIPLVRSLLTHIPGPDADEVREVLTSISQTRRLARQQAAGPWPVGSLPAPAISERITRLTTWATGQVQALQERCDEHQSLAALTPRQLEVARHAAAGLTNRQIGRQLGISEWTAVNHLRAAMSKLDCPSRTHLWKHLNQGQ